MGDDRPTRAPLGEHVGVHRYVAWQQAFDPLLTAGARNYWTSNKLSTLPDGLFDAVIAVVGTLPFSQCEMFSRGARQPGAAAAVGASRSRGTGAVAWNGGSDDSRA